jgi:tRNA pseudouridine55 synthase
LKVHGLLLLDKPRGLTSNAALQRARRLLEADKAGHGGTLDPLAEGLLPLLFGEACKLAGAALEGDKAYEAVVRLGQVTSTDDGEGEIVASSPVEFDDPALEAALAALRGPIEQVPPVYSALKVQGKALYRHAREGRPVQPAARRVVIHELTLLDRTGGDAPTLTLRVACSKGTYIRSLARDLGAALACGAHLAGLRRTAVGRFRLEQAIDLEALEALAPEGRRTRLVDLEALVAGWPSATLEPEDARAFCHGQEVAIDAAALQPGAADSAERIAVSSDGRLVGLARLMSRNESTCLLAPARIIVP